MSHFAEVDLYFKYQDDDLRRGLEITGLMEDEIEVLLEALTHRFHGKDCGTFAFSVRSRNDYSPLDWVKRNDGGLYADSGFNRESIPILGGLDVTVPDEEMTDQQRRWLDVQRTAWAMSREINRFRGELCRGDFTSSVLTIISRDELLGHLQEIEYSPPARVDPAVPGAVDGSPEIESSHPHPSTAHEMRQATPPSIPQPDSTAPVNVNRQQPTHSSDFTSVNWFGTRYAFSKGNQARSVKVLWEAWAEGGHGLSQETIGERIDSNADRFEMRKTFRRVGGDGEEIHPAWGTMIQRDGKGCCRLVPPESV